MNLRSFIKMVGATVLAALAFGGQAAIAKNTQKPNIIFFLVDDYDKPETSVYGGNVLTPNLDRLANEGVTFHNAYMTSTVCTPSRYTCLTGRYAGSSYSSAYLSEFPKGTQGLPAFNVALEKDHMNVGRVLSENGYATGFIGKYHAGGEENHSPELREEYGLHAIPKNASWSEEINRKQFENEKIHREMLKEQGFTWAKNIYWGNMKAPFKGHNPEWTVSAALEFIEEHKDGPFYLHYGTTLLHGPNSEWHRSLSKPLVTNEGILKEPIGLMDRDSVMERITEAGLTSNEAGYLWMDDSLGLVLDKLDELGIADNTIVLFVADHGSNRKGSLYRQRGTEVPCIMRWPNGMPQGVQSDSLIQNTDFVPTWFDVAGAKVPDGYKMDGVSLTPIFENPQADVRDYVYAEMGASRAVRTKEWSYMALRFTKDQVEEMRQNERSIERTLTGLSGGISRGRGNPESMSYDQLYSIASNPEETNNLASNPEFSGKLEEMKQLLVQELKRFPDRPFGEFIPGGNAIPAGSYDDILEAMRNYMSQFDGDIKKQSQAKKKKNKRKGVESDDTSKKAERQARKAKRDKK
ncbi:sulfatase family protein [Pelagicoccus mobilis]|uniref:Sulfatase-like hydrolase/transferase n=1 Tax=Pelagicoccus mobilis TaxID=415221 RepID=A0A934RW18_9BACT|nr:sulfatase-like hydrolase/transferase [Pelagicoccus mobilis]MBK1876510.1 sulfatase-like hydrolase/transferase [Pelagicoccus mobilis]